MNGIAQYWPLAVPAVLGFVAVYVLLPKSGASPSKTNWGGLALGLGALIAAGFLWIRPTGAPIQDVLFYLFGAAAVIAAAFMITNANPVYAALWFALATLSVCGLFLLQSAPFLAAATVIVYAGAIVVTFLFVIMLARQAGSAEYDRHAREPFLASLTAFVLLGGILYTLGEWIRTPTGETVAANAASTEKIAGNSTESPFLKPQHGRPNSLSNPADGDKIGTMRGLGRSLFGDYLYAVELAGTLLLVASIGAILIAPRRSRGNP